MKAEDKVFYSHIGAALLAGLASGIFNLSPPLALSLFIAVYALSSQGLEMLGLIEISEIEKPSKLYTSGMFSSIVLFLFTWIFITNLLTIEPALSVIIFHPRHEKGLFLMKEGVRVKGVVCNTYLVIAPFSPEEKSMSIKLGVFRAFIGRDMFIYTNADLKEGLFFNSSSGELRVFRLLRAPINGFVRIPWVRGDLKIELEDGHLIESKTDSYRVMRISDDLIELRVNIDGEEYRYLVRTTPINAEATNVTFFGPALWGGNITLAEGALNFSSVGETVLTTDEGVYVIMGEVYDLRVGRAVRVDDCYLVLSEYE